MASVVSTLDSQVPSPWDEHAQRSSEITDIVLHSKDLVDSSLVRAASSSPNTIIPLGILAAITANDRTTIINVAEDSKVLRRLLYHISDELDIQDSRLYIQVVPAAHRYGMTIIDFESARQWPCGMASPLISKVPLRILYVASALGWAELATSAGSHCKARL